MRLGLRVGLVGLGMVLGGAAVWGQAAAIPSAGVARVEDAGRGRELLAAMVTALGGEAWLNRRTWRFTGRTAMFYKGQPDGRAPGFEEDGRMQPFAERVVFVEHYGAIVAKDHRDVMDVWVGGRGWEVTYKGASALPAAEVAEFARRRAHSLDVVVKEWLKQPGVVVTYGGPKMVERRLADEVSVLSAGDDAVVIDLDQASHLPLRVSFQWRDPVYRDWNTDVEEFADYHEVQGVMTAYSVITLHNGDTTGEKLLTGAAYNAELGAEVFDPKQALEKKGK